MCLPPLSMRTCDRGVEMAEGDDEDRAGASDLGRNRRPDHRGCPSTAAAAAVLA